ncbi:SIP domain-containing protein [Saccharopolyspora erythraea]|nr:SIP domain-containing protein [Saccharopolyspora erythraea]
MRAGTAHTNAHRRTELQQSLPVSLVEVTEVERITPRTARITFAADGLAAAIGDEPDQQVKLYFPRPGQDRPRLPEPDGDGDVMRWYQSFLEIPEDQRPWMRSYTIRSHDAGRDLVTIDFVLHDDAGPATRWALSAAPGDTIGVFGPSADYARRVPLSSTIAGSDLVLMAGDETALPAIGTLVESLPDGARAVAYLEVADSAEEQRLDTRADLTVHWLHRGATPPGRSTLLLDAVRAADIPAGSVFAWLAGEAGVVRTLRRHLVGERGMDKRAVDFAGYWRLALSQDDAPTDDDLAEAREKLADAKQQAEPTAMYDQAYEAGSAPWVIGEPQPVVVGLARDGWVRGAVLDPGCGTGENSIHLASLGHDVLGTDFSEIAVAQARLNAVEHGCSARFEVSDALALEGPPRFDTVVDSALFHVFDAADRLRYARALHRVCRPGALVHVLALSDEGPGYGPQVSAEEIRAAFGAGWVVEDVSASTYRGVVGATDPDDPGTWELGDLPAWLARIRRI